MTIPVQPLLMLSHALFCLGVYGILTRRNAIGLLLSIELILNAAALNFVLFGRLFGDVQGQAFALFIIALAACEAGVGLAIIVSLWRNAKTIDADSVDLLKG
ncbi:MAG: NADH-quinone oxidoreductase subunit NuoK [Candidatus Omnitrophica bacterium]|nr:NADH-quinone oxidoreductase subunit NuoK [Candidatus Omnitrophota bacterium]